LTTGVMACVIYGLNGAASMSWHMSLKAKRSASMQHFWDVLTFTMNVSTAGSVGVGHSKCICFKIIHVIYACWRSSWMWVLLGLSVWVIASAFAYYL
jgi:NhaP-type Na+/H+ or K+/H+ antiporter